MKLHAAAAVLALAAACALAGCADDPHPESGSTPGDPWHPDSTSIENDQPAPMTPPGSSGTRPPPGPPGASQAGMPPPSTQNGYGDPTTVEESK